MSAKKFMVLVVEYDAKNEEVVKKSIDDLQTKTAIKVSCHYQGSDERVIKAVKSNLANAV